MNKNFLRFFVVAAVAGVALFPVAYAYPIGGQPSPASGSSSYDFGDSLTSLFTPFTNFIKSIEESNKTTIDIHQISNMPAPNYNLDIGGYFVQFDDWVYAKTGFRPSEMFVVALKVLLWVINIVKVVIDWLLGVLHA